MSGPSVGNIVLGVWLAVSAFLWPHSNAQFNNALIVGLLIAIFGVVASRGVAFGAYANAALGAWLFLSSFFLPTLRAGTFWNHLLVGIGVFVLAMVRLLPSGGRYGRPARMPSRL
jgi:nitric oxide reductase large subunit